MSANVLRGRGIKNSELQWNILLIANYESNVGYAWWLMENFWVQISEYFTTQSKKCFLIYPKINVVPNNIQRAPITLIEHDFSDRSKVSRTNLRKIIKNNNIRSAYLTDKKIYDIDYLLLRKWGVRRIVLHDHAPGERLPLPLYKKIIKNLIHSMRIFSCDHYIGVSKFVYNRLINYGCIPPGKCSYILNGIIPIQISEKNRFYAHEQFNIPKDSLVIITTGRATFYKRIDFLIECANILINEKMEDNLFFIHCGDGPDLKTFKEMAKEYNLTDRFIFTGKRFDIPQILQSCDIAVQTSLGEAFSLSILEYMSAGLATLVPDHCGNDEAITDGGNGILYHPGDIEFVTKLLLSLAHDSKLRKKIGSSAIQTIQDKFNIKRTNIELIKILHNKL